MNLITTMIIIIIIRNYFLGRIEQSTMHKEVAEMDRAATPLRLSDRHYNPFQQIRIRDRLIEDWKRKGLHGKYPALIDQSHIAKNRRLAG